MSEPQMKNKRGEWVPAIPLPFYGLKKRCSCGKSFWTTDGYRGHYAYKHILEGELPHWSKPSAPEPTHAD